MNKKQTITLSLLLVTIVLSVIGATYAYIRVSTTASSNEARIVTDTVELTFDDKDTEKNIITNASLGIGTAPVVRHFTVNNSGGPTYINMLFEGLTNTYTLGSLKYTLKSGSTEGTYTSTLVNNANVPVSATSSNKKLINGLLVSSGTTYYELTISYIIDNELDQTNDLNATFYTGFSAESGSEPKKIYCVDENGDEMTCPTTLAIGQRIAVGGYDNVQYFRYIRTTNTSDTTHTYNECNDGGSASIACTDADSRHPLENNQLRLLAEYNLYVGAICDSSGNKISDVDTTSTTYGLQDSRALGDVANQNRVGTVAYGTSNDNYSESNVKSYTDTYANYLNTTYFGGENEVSGSAITFEELVMLGCNRSGGEGACSGAPNWVYTTSYWSFSPYSAISIWYVKSNAYLYMIGGNYDRADTFGVRPVITINKDLI